MINAEGKKREKRERWQKKKEINSLGEYWNTKVNHQTVQFNQPPGPNVNPGEEETINDKRGTEEAFGRGRKGENDKGIREERDLWTH